jgi:hypothetical protein
MVMDLTMNKVILGAAFVIAAMFAAQLASAYEIEMFDCDGEDYPLTWSEDPVTVCVDYNSDEDNKLWSCKEYIANAISNWTRAWNETCGNPGSRPLLLQPNESGDCGQNGGLYASRIRIRRDDSKTGPDTSGLWEGTVGSCYSGRAIYSYGYVYVKDTDTMTCSRLKRLIEHELGHALGLAHSTETARMNEDWYSASSLTDDDKTGLRNTQFYNETCTE